MIYHFAFIATLIASSLFANFAQADDSKELILPDFSSVSRPNHANELKATCRDRTGKSVSDSDPAFNGCIESVHQTSSPASNKTTNQMNGTVKYETNFHQ